MFRVENADFIAEKLSAELLPDQEQREVYKNAEEAILRRFAATGESSGGSIEFDVDWPMHAETGEWLISCSDNGDGMTRDELSRYTTTLAVQGADGNQSVWGNQGMGLKISGPTRHKRGLLIRSMKNGERTMVQVGWDGEEYGLIPVGPNDEVVMSVPEDFFPEMIRKQGSGTVVTFLGNKDPDNTFLPDGRRRGWLFKYLHQRFFNLSGNGIEVYVRVPSGDEPDWPDDPESAAARQRGEGKSFNRSLVRGTGPIWTKASVILGEDYSGAVELAGDPKADIPAARMHWWVLPTGPGSDVSSRTWSGGSISVLFQNELHDWRTSGQANPYFARLGVLFGKTRMAFVLEPLGSTIASDFARAHVLVGGRPAFEGDAWMVWSEQFRDQLPDQIRETMEDERSRLEADDPDRAKRIQNRLKDVMQLLRPRRFKRDEQGNLMAGGPSVTGPGEGAGSVYEVPIGSPKPPPPAKKSSKGIGSVLAELDADESDSALEVFSMLKLNPKWVSESEAEGFTIVNGNGAGLHDRAAALAGEDGATADILLLNRDFRGYQAIVVAMNEFANPEGDEDKSVKIESFAQEWVEQKMVEAVNGLRQLANGRTWLATNFDDALSPLALTAAFMADRYHTLREIKRDAGSLRAKPVAMAADSE